MSNENIDVLAALERRTARTFRAWKLSVRRLNTLEGEARQIAHAKAQKDELIWKEAERTQRAVAELIERADYLCRTGEGMIALRAALARVHSS